MSALPKYETRAQLAFFMNRRTKRTPVPLIIAAYFERFQQAVSILLDDPEQIRTREPFAGLTALHVAVFRGHVQMVKLLAEHPRADLAARDNFERRAIDMCRYTSNSQIFEILYGRTFSHPPRGIDTSS